MTTNLWRHSEYLRGRGRGRDWVAPYQVRNPRRPRPGPPSDGDRHASSSSHDLVPRSIAQDLSRTTSMGRPVVRALDTYSYKSTAIRRQVLGEAIGHDVNDFCGPRPPDEPVWPIFTWIGDECHTYYYPEDGSEPQVKFPMLDAELDASYDEDNHWVQGWIRRCRQFPPLLPNPYPRYELHHCPRGWKCIPTDLFEHPQEPGTMVRSVHCVPIGRKQPPTDERHGKMMPTYYIDPLAHRRGKPRPSRHRGGTWEWHADQHPSWQLGG